MMEYGIRAQDTKHQCHRRGASRITGDGQQHDDDQGVNGEAERTDDAQAPGNEEVEQRYAGEAARQNAGDR